MTRLATYKKYKDSGVPWLGEVPAHWEVKRLSWLVSERKETADNTFAPLSVGQAGVTHQLEGTAKPSGKDLRKRACVGDIVINSRSDRRGASGLSNYEGAVSVVYIVIRLMEGNPEFLAYLLKSSRFQYEFYRWGNGIVDDLWTTRFSEMRLIDSVVPPLKEQEAIAAYLDAETERIDEIIDKKQEQISLLEERRRALITHAVTRGLDPKAKMKDSGIPWLGKIPKHWEVKKLKYVAEVKASNVDKIARDEEVDVLQCNYTDVYYSEKIEATEGFLETTATAQQIEHFSLLAGDVAFTKDSEGPDDIAVPAYVPEDIPNVVYGYHLSIARSFPEQLLGAYLHRFMEGQASRGYFEFSAKGITRYGISQQATKDARTLLPPLHEQKKIADYLDVEAKQIDGLIYQINHSLDLLTERRAALITAAVTGQIKVA